MKTNDLNFENRYAVGDLVVVAYDCWLHNFNGSEFIRKGEMAIIVQKRDQLMYKPIKIFTDKGLMGWVYASNIEVLVYNYNI